MFRPQQSSKYSRDFWLPLPDSKVDLGYINSLDPEEDQAELFYARHVKAYSVHGAKITVHQPSEFILMEVLVHLYLTGFIRPL